MCGARLSVHESARGSYCGEQACRQQAGARDALADAARRTALRQSAMEHLQRLAPEVAAAADTLVAVVPSNDRQIGPLCVARRAAFATRLAATVSRAAGELDDLRASDSATDDRSIPADENVATTTHDAEPDSLTVDTCGICRGQCCWQGGDHAFLHEETLIRYMISEPGLSTVDVLDNYLALLPTDVYDQSCVYHGASGCALPREMRSDLCNRYHCKGLNELNYRRQGNATGAVFVATTDDTRLVRFATFTDTNTDKDKIDVESL